MLKTPLVHPEILAVLARAGHHATVLIADGNYPASTARGPNATVVSLNLSPGVVSCVQVLEALAAAVPIDIANTMIPETDGPYAMADDPPVWAEFRRVLRDAGLTLELSPVEKWAFYERVKTPDHVLTIQTGDQQRFANLLLHLGVRMD